MVSKIRVLKAHWDSRRDLIERGCDWDRVMGVRGSFGLISSWPLLRGFFLCMIRLFIMVAIAHSRLPFVNLSVFSLFSAQPARWRCQNGHRQLLRLYPWSCGGPVQVRAEVFHGNCADGALTVMVGFGPSAFVAGSWWGVGKGGYWLSFNGWSGNEALLHAMLNNLLLFIHRVTRCVYVSVAFILFIGRDIDTFLLVCFGRATYEKKWNHRS